MMQATVAFDPAVVTPERLVARIRDTGYEAELASPDQTAFEEQAARDQAQAEEFAELLQNSGITRPVVDSIALHLRYISGSPSAIHPGTASVSFSSSQNVS